MKSESSNTKEDTQTIQTKMINLEYENIIYKIKYKST